MKLFARPCFYQPWTVSELAFRNDVVLVCGRYEVEQQGSYRSPLRWVLLGPRSPSLAEATRNHIESLCFIPGLRQLSTAEAYPIVRNCRATDPRDAVLAIKPWRHPRRRRYRRRR